MCALLEVIGTWCVCSAGGGRQFCHITALVPLQLVKDEPDLEPESVKHIFIENVMKLEPQTLTDNGFRCFDRFFRHVNCNDHKLRQWRRTLLTDNLDLMGLEYLWEVILTAQQGIAHKAIDSMKDIYTNLTPQLKEQNVRGKEGETEEEGGTKEGGRGWGC